MTTVSIPKVGEVNFPDSMSAEDIRKHSGRMHRLAGISARTGPVDVTRSLPFAKKSIASGNNSPDLAHFVSKAEHIPSGRHVIDFGTGRHAYKSLPSDGKDLNVSEFRRLLHEDLSEATSRAGTRGEWLDVDKPERGAPPASAAPAPRKLTAPSVISALKQIAAERK
jgi:hypothetical protein